MYNFKKLFTYMVVGALVMALSISCKNEDKTGGVAYIYGRHNEINVNLELVDILELSKEDENELKALIKEHIDFTGSKRAIEILAKFKAKNFFKIMPRDYKNMLNMIESCKGEENPELAAFLKLSENIK